MSATPAQYSQEVEENYPFIDRRNAQQLSITIHEDTVDSGSTVTTQLRSGLVLGETSTAGVFIDAEDSNVAASVKSSVTSAENVDSDWASTTITVTVLETGASYSVTAAGSDDAAAEFVTLINADAGIAAVVVASADGSDLVITAREYGVTILVESTLSTAFGASGTTSTNGSVTRHVILDTPVLSMLQFGTARKQASVGVVANAVVRESLLTGLTAEARQSFKLNNIQLRGD